MSMKQKTGKNNHNKMDTKQKELKKEDAANVMKEKMKKQMKKKNIADDKAQKTTQENTNNKMRIHIHRRRISRRR